MVSEVNGPRLGQVSPLDTRSTKVDKAGGVSGVSATVGAANDVVTLTDLASQLQALVQSVSDVPVINQEKIAHFRQQLADGSYEVDPQAVAEKFSAIESLLADLATDK
jgi:negative regulator of flagellin synthesis FlgM